MPAITALLHTVDVNDRLRIGRALETLYPCDEIVVVDHSANDATQCVVREYGASVVTAKTEVIASDYLRFAANDWIFCLEPNESVTEGLAASLFEWRELRSENLGATARAVLLREETVNGWMAAPRPQIRLIPRTWNHWQNHLPSDEPYATVLEGEVLRFNFP